MLVEVEAKWELADHLPVVEAPEAGVFLTQPEPEDNGHGVGHFGSSCSNMASAERRAASEVRTFFSACSRFIPPTY